jgi:hypothetical protein
MAEDAADDGTVLGLATRAGVLSDTLTSESVTEHAFTVGSGSDGPTMRDHLKALQVVGDAIAGFNWRGNPDGEARPIVSWNLGAFSWGELLERPLASALWLVLAQFMIDNPVHLILSADPEPKRESEPEPLHPDSPRQVGPHGAATAGTGCAPSVHHRVRDGDGEPCCSAARRPSKACCRNGWAGTLSSPAYRLPSPCRRSALWCPPMGDQPRNGQPVQGAETSRNRCRKT